jgi:outer membrane protein TolC
MKKIEYKKQKLLKSRFNQVNNKIKVRLKMNLKRLFYLLIFVSLCLTNILQAQTLTQDKFLDLLKEKHPLFEKEKLAIDIEKAGRNIYPGAEDWNFFSSANFTHDQPPIAFSGPERMEVLTFSAGMERLYWETGARLSTSISTSATNIGLPAMAAGIFPENFLQHQISLTYTKPLRRNKGGFLDKFAYNLKKYDIDFSKVKAEEVKENFLARAAQKYLDWVYVNEQIKIFKERIKLSEEELENVKKKREAYLVDEVDIIRAEDAVRFWKQNLLLVESQWNALQGELAVLAQEENIKNLSPDFNLFKLKEIPPVESIKPGLRDTLRVTKVIEVRKNQLGYVKKGFEEMLKPDLSLYGEFNLRRVEDKVFRSFLLDKPMASVGLKYSFQKKNLTAKAQIEKNKIEVKYLDKQIEEIVVNITSALTNLYIQIEEMKDVLNLNLEQIESTRKKTEEELKLYNQGRGQLTFVIQSRDSEQNAKLTYTANALTYQKLIVEYLSLIDQLLK